MSKLPKPYTDFREEFPAVAAAYDALGSAAHESGPLDDRTRQLVKLALAIGARQEGAVRGHTRRALALGLSRDEIMQVVLLSITTCGFSMAVAAYTWIRDALEET